MINSENIFVKKQQKKYYKKITILVNGLQKIDVHYSYKRELPDFVSRTT
jgi:hypothetical protein